MPALAPKWEAVAQALADGQSHRLAYQAGGYIYKPANAHRFCTKREIQDRVIEIRTQREEMANRARIVAAEKSGVDLAWIEMRQKYAVERALRGEPVRDRDGRKKRDPESGEVIYKPDLQAANQGLITLGRMKGAFIDRTEIGGPGDFGRLNDAELHAKLIELGSALGVPEDVIRQLEWKPQEAAE